MKWIQIHNKEVVYDIVKMNNFKESLIKYQVKFILPNILCAIIAFTW